jgi:tetratricopeptide (TPR) repeat protein
MKYMAKVTRKEVMDKIQKAGRYTADKNNPKKAIQILEKLLKNLNPSEEEYYEVVLVLSGIYRNSKSYKKAEKLLNKVVIKAKQFKEDIYLAQIYTSLSFINLHKGEITNSKKYLRKAQALIKSKKGFKVKKITANIYATYGNIYFRDKKYKKALEEYEKSLEMSKEIGYRQREITLKNDIANVYLEQKKFDKARNLLLLIKTEAKEDYQLALPQVLLRLARIEYLESNDSRAIAYTQEALKFAEKKDWKRQIAEAKEALAFIYKRQGKEKKRRSQLKQAQKIYKELGLLKKVQAMKKRL